MPNFTYMAVNWVYLVALAVWVGGMGTFAALFAPSLTAVLSRPEAGRVVAVFLGRFRTTVTGCVALIVTTSAVKFMLWETITPWLLLRWLLLGGMIAMALYDFMVLAPRLSQAKAAGDEATFGRLHRTAVTTMSATLLMGLGVFFFS